jgi:hypothetical protein
MRQKMEVTRLSVPRGNREADEMRFPLGNKPPQTLIVHLRRGLWFDITQRIYSGSTDSKKD